MDRPLQRKWESYKQDVAVDQVEDEIQLERLEIAFYAGAQCLLDVIATRGTDYRHALNIVQVVRAELEAFDVGKRAAHDQMRHGRTPWWSRWKNLKPWW